MATSARMPNGDRRSPAACASGAAHEARAIARIACPSRETFVRDWAERGTPVVLTGLADAWPARAQWSATRLRERAGTRTIPIKTYERGARHAFPRYTEMTLAAYLDLQDDPAERARYRLGDVPLARFLPELLADVACPRIVESPRHRACLFVGVDTFCNAHFHHADEAVLTQVVGPKRVLLVPPERAAALYPVPWWRPANGLCLVDLEHPDLERHPAYRSADPLEVVLAPGESLYIPVHWYHAAFGLGWSASVTHYWPSKLRRWHFPFPGWRALGSPIRLQRFVFPVADAVGGMGPLVAALRALGPKA